MTVAVTIKPLNLVAVNSARFAELHSLISAQTGGYYTASTSGEKYPSWWCMAMAYAYEQTGTASYLTDVMNEFNYIKTAANADGILVDPTSSAVERDWAFRTIWHLLIAGRLLRLAGDRTDAQTIISQCDTWAQDWYSKINSGSPNRNVTQNGWDASNATGAPAWAASTLYYRGQRRAGGTNVFEAQTNGLSNTSAPTWPTTIGATVTDRDVIWKCVQSCTPWAATNPQSLGDIVIPTTANGYSYRCITPGTTGSTQPTWPTTQQATVTDGTVTWRCVATTQPCSFGTYNSTSPYTGQNTPTFDFNQEAEEALMWALFITEPMSAYYTSQATPQARIMQITSLATAYQASGGKIPIGDPISPTDGRCVYDNRYATYSLFTLSIVYQLAQAYCHADLLTLITAGLNWIDTVYGTEPLVGAHYDTSYTLQLTDICERIMAYRLLNKAPSYGADIDYTGAFSNPFSSDQVGYYQALSPPGTMIAAIQARNMFDTAAVRQALAGTVIPGHFFMGM